MKIIFKTNSFPNISETFIVTNIIEAIKRGFKVTVLTNRLNQITDTSQLNLLEDYQLMNQVLRYSSPKEKKKRLIKAVLLVLNPIRFFYFLKYIIFKRKISLEYLFILKFYEQYRDSEIFHVHFATAINPLFDLKAIGFLNSKLIVTFHGYDAHFLPKGELLKKIIKNFNCWVSSITVNSLFLKQKLVNKGFIADNIKIIPIGIDTDFFNNNLQMNIKEEVFKIITVGRLIELKGQSFGIKAIKLLRDKGYNVVYTLVGKGEELESLKQLVLELNLEDSVCFLGSKNQEEIRELLKDSNLFLMTSTMDKTNRTEAFGVVSLEAQSMGIPVVGFDSGGFPETLIKNKTGIIVKDKGIEALADAVGSLIEDKIKLVKMGTEAKKHIKKNFDINNMMKEYLNLYS